MKKLLLVFLPLLTGCEVVGWFAPPVRTYIAETEGKSKLAEATYSRQIKIREAEARLESARLDAQSEIERAKGVAEANKIIGESLKDNESYLRYLWVQGLQNDANEVIYVPTEANLPILEAGRRK